MGGREIIGEDDARRLAAHAAFEAYDFGEAVVAATGSWNFEPVAARSRRACAASWNRTWAAREW